MKVLSFPHPVLGFNDDISGEFRLSIHIALNGTKRVFELNVDVDISNKYIYDLWNSSALRCLLKVTCSSTMKMQIFEIPPPQPASFQIDELSVADELTLDAYLVAADTIPIYKDTTFNSIFNGIDFSLDRGDIVGIVASSSIPIPSDNEEMGLGALFNWQKVKPNEPIQFKVDCDEIQILYPANDSGEDLTAVMLKTTFWVGYNIYVIPALTYAIDYLKAPPDEQQFMWMDTILEMIADQNWRNTESYVLAQNILKKDEIKSPSVMATEDFYKRLVSIDD